jgi:hypothetical protein
MKKATALLLPLLLLSFALEAATFVVPDDAALVAKTPAIVVGMVTVSFSRFNPAGGIETVSEIAVEESIKGPLAAGERIEIVEPGGRVGGLLLVIPGSPRYLAGDRVVVFMTAESGRWRTVDMILGQFRLVDGPQGRRLAVRGDAEESVVGWSVSGEPHREPVRDAERFLRFVRETASGVPRTSDYVIEGDERTRLRDERRFERSYGVARLVPVTAAQTFVPVATASAYAMDFAGTLHARWRSFTPPTATVTFLTFGQQTGQIDSIGSVDRGIAAWNNEANSTIQYARGGTTTVNQAFKDSNNVNTIIFNDPSNEIPGSFTGSGTLATGGFWAATSLMHDYNGESFATILEADMVVQNGVVLSVANFDALIAHELGHTLGIRHSNEGTPNTGNALMNSSLINNMGANLQPWDRDAAATLYGPCITPAITFQPAPVTASAGVSIGLQVAAAGTLPMSVQWYRGAVGDTSQPLAPGSLGVTGPLSLTTTFWARVTNACQQVSSQPVTVTVVPVQRRRSVRR